MSLVHPVGGDVHAYRPLVEALDPGLGACVTAEPAGTARHYHAEMRNRPEVMMAALPAKWSIPGSAPA